VHQAQGLTLGIGPFVGVGQTVQGLDDDPHRRRRRQPAVGPGQAAQQLGQRVALDQLEGDVEGAVVTAGVQDPGDVGIVEETHQVGFPAKAPAHLFGLLEPLLEELEDAEFAGPALAGQVDASHPAFGELLEQAVAAKGPRRRHLCLVQRRRSIHAFPLYKGGPISSPLRRWT
jgi:hypothetical protein